MNELQPLFDYIQSIGAASAAGAVAAIVAALWGAVKVFRLAPIQGLLPEKARWANLPKWLRVVLVWGIPVIATAITSIASGLGASATVGACVAALVAAMAAGGIDGAQTALGKPAVQALPDSKPNP